MHSIRILLAEDMLHERILIEKKLSATFEGKVAVSFTSVDNAEAAVKLAKQSEFDLVILDIDFSHSASSKGMTGLDASREIKKFNPDIYTVIVSSSEEEETMLLAVNYCQVDRYFRRSSIRYDELAWLAQRALLGRLHRDGSLLDERYRFLTSSPAVKKSLREVDSILPNQSTLIFGETGTGKELIARRIHANAKAFEPKRPFRALDCASLPANLFESAIFGRKKGAFTGADSDRAGILQLVNGGDLFLDEIHNIPIDLQQKLLRALNDGIFSPVGSTEEIFSKFRIIAATNIPVDESIKSGKLLPDFVARIRNRRVNLLPLRERKEDIPLLINRCLENVGSFDKEFSSEAIAFLQDLPWPANIRELNSLVESAVTLVEIPIINGSHLKRLTQMEAPEAIPTQTGDALSLVIEESLNNSIPLTEIFTRLERGYLMRAKDRFSSKAECASAMGYDRSTLARRLKTLGISF